MQLNIDKTSLIIVRGTCALVQCQLCKRQVFRCLRYVMRRVTKAEDDRWLQAMQGLKEATFGSGCCVALIKVANRRSVTGQ